jgi:hypothetical protein
LSDEADILSSLDRIESLVDGFLELGKSEDGYPPLSLELICGQTGVDPEHYGYWEGPEGGELYHPKHQQVKDEARKHGIQVNVSSHADDGMYFSDAYVKFHPHQIDTVANILKQVGHPGDILDIGPLSPDQHRHVLDRAKQEGWVIGDNQNDHGFAKSEDRVYSSSDPTVLDISKAPPQHLEPSFYRITPEVKQAYQMMGRGASVANGQYVSDPSPSVSGGVSLAFDNDKDLHDYIENVYEPHLVKNVLPSIAANKAVLLAPIPTHSMKHGNHSPFLTINHLHNVSVSQDRRGRIPFYYAMAKLASEAGHVHPMTPPAISEYNEGPHQHHMIKMVDGNGRTVSARTAGSSHVLSYVAMKPEHVDSFLKMLKETAPSEDMSVRSILGLPEFPKQFSVADISRILSHTKKSERVVLDNLDKVESLVDALIGRH